MKCLKWEKRGPGFEESRIQVEKQETKALHCGFRIKRLENWRKKTELKE
jgi:hypothetical protein